MKIVFLNTYDAQITEPLREFLRAHKETIDVFCFQEVYAGMQPLLEEELGGFAQRAATKPEPGDKFFSNVTLVRDTLAIENSSSNEQSGATGLALFTAVRYQGTLVHIANVHGLPRPGKLDNLDRLRQSHEILSALEAAQGIKIIGGDLNVLLETESVRLFEDSGYKNLIKDFDIKTTRNRIAWDKHPGNELYYSDYVFVRGAGTASFEVPSQIVSDHQPMIVEVDLD